MIDSGSNGLQDGGPAERGLTRASEATREALIEAATSVFAEHGYNAGSVRLITREAGANQAAITYHFGGKDQLYRAVLRAAVAAFESQSVIDEDSVVSLEREAALRLVIRQFFSPLGDKGRLGRYIRIFGWEGVNPSAVYSAYFAEETPRLFKLVNVLVRRFLPPEPSERDVALTAFWLIQQPIAFVRNAERLVRPPFELVLDEAEIDRLAEFVTALSLGGLTGRPSGP